MSIHLVLDEDVLMVVEGDLDVEGAAAAGAWIIRHRPFPGNNREIGYEVMRQMLDEAGHPWPRPHEDVPAIEAMLGALEAGTLSVPKFVDWVRLRVATA